MPSEKPIGVIESPKPKPMVVPTPSESINYEQLVLYSGGAINTNTHTETEEIAAQRQSHQTFTLPSPMQYQPVVEQYELPLDGVGEVLTPQKPNTKNGRKKTS